MTMTMMVRGAEALSDGNNGARQTSICRPKRPKWGAVLAEQSPKALKPQGVQRSRAAKNTPN